MASGLYVPVAEYLGSVYEPDCEYADGQLVAKNVGEYSHSRLHGLLYAYFLRRSAKWGIVPIIEQRIQIRANKFLIPDICILHGPEPTSEIVSEPPLIWIEILSGEERPIRVSSKVQEVLAFGVRYVWVIDPENLESYVATRSSQAALTDGVFRIEELGIVVPLFEIKED